MKHAKNFNFVEKVTGAIVPPIFLSSNFAEKSPGVNSGFEYTRVSNPTVDLLEKKLAHLEKGRFGICFASGTAAASTVLSTLKAGDHIICANQAYDGTFRLLKKVFSKFNVQFDLVDLSQLKQLDKAILPNTKLIWFETPTNPTLRIFDIRKITNIAHLKDVKVLVDNTFASPLSQNPLELGADIVLHSLSKSISGHSDAIGGALILNDTNLRNEIKFLQHTIGGCLSPFNAFMVLRGIKTLELRVRRSEESAMSIAMFLCKNPKINKVFFPGLINHDGHKIAQKQMRGFGTIVSFQIRGSKETAVKFCENLRVFLIASSFGGTESLVQHPWSMIDQTLSKKDLSKTELTENLLRLSIGLEDCNELMNDLDQALNGV